MPAATRPELNDAETWLTGVVNRAALLATEIAQLTDYLTTHRIADPATVINAHADALEERLRRLETAADTRNASPAGRRCSPTGDRSWYP